MKLCSEKAPVNAELLNWLFCLMIHAFVSVSLQPHFHPAPPTAVSPSLITKQTKTQSTE